MGSLGSDLFDVRNVAIIGAGPCGLSAAKYLLSEGVFEKVVTFEQQEEVGGVWFYNEIAGSAPSVPQTNPFPPVERPTWGDEGDRGGSALFPSPMYRHLHTNIPHSLMQYGDQPFPSGPESTVFPSREAIQQYLVDYSRDVRHLIRFSTQVTSLGIRPMGNDHARYDITSRSFLTDKVVKETYDAVVVASGHYATAYIPEVQGIKAFSEAHPQVISHAKTYRIPEIFAGQKVIIVGNAASGLDIAAQISRHCISPLLLSVRKPTPAANLDYIGAVEVPEICRYIADSRSVEFVDGRVESDVDAVLYCTGYLYTLPFFETKSSADSPLITDGRKIGGLYKHLIDIDHPTLVFPGLPMKVVPFPVSEAQAAIIARVWSNRLRLPPAGEMRQWERDEMLNTAGRGYHVFPPGGDGAYLDELHTWAMTATGEKGKEPPTWTDEQKWQRTVYFEAKLRFDQTGQSARSLAELGLVYKPSPVE